jgi:hypothetical protein
MGQKRSRGAVEQWSRGTLGAGELEREWMMQGFMVISLHGLWPRKVGRSDV